MYKEDLIKRINVIHNLEKEILQEKNRIYRRKKINELLLTRENFRLQFYNETIKDNEISNILIKEAISFVKFQEKLLISVGSCNSEFAKYLRLIINTCEQTEFLGTDSIINESKKSLFGIYEKVFNGSNITRGLRLRYIIRCQFVLNQKYKDVIGNKSKSVSGCNIFEK